MWPPLAEFLERNTAGAGTEPARADQRGSGLVASAMAALTTSRSSDVAMTAVSSWRVTSASMGASIAFQSAPAPKRRVRRFTRMCFSPSRRPFSMPLLLGKADLGALVEPCLELCLMLTPQDFVLADHA